MDTHSLTPWEFTYFSKPDETPIQTVQDVAITCSHSVLQSERAELWGVSLPNKAEDGSVLVICYTGNGPASKANAEFIARACNSYEDFRQQMRDMKGQIDELMNELRRGPDRNPRSEMGQ